jgi:hypothetical protein
MFTFFLGIIAGYFSGRVNVCVRVHIAENMGYIALDAYFYALLPLGMSAKHTHEYSWVSLYILKT